MEDHMQNKLQGFFFVDHLLPLERKPATASIFTKISTESPTCFLLVPPADHI